MVQQNMHPEMIANNLKPYQPTHLGVVLKDELEYRGISQRGLAWQSSDPADRCRLMMHEAVWDASPTR